MPYDPPRCRITVVKRTLRQDLAARFLVDASGFGPCGLYYEGQEFVLESPFEVPEGLCPWAWANMRDRILAGATGSSLPWLKQPGTALAACTDALRPVIFLIERIE